VSFVTYEQQGAIVTLTAFQALVQESSDHAEAVAAVLEKRTPIFTGR
jgi:hypothetical protein